MLEVFDLKNQKVKTAEKILSPKPGCKFTVGHVNLEPGQSVGEHSTKDHEEIIYVISGEGVMLTPNNTVPMREGNLIHVQSQQTHNVKNNSRKILKYLFIVT